MPEPMLSSLAAGHGPVEATHVLHRSPTAAAVEAEHESVVLDERTDQVHLLNSSATAVWACLDGEGTLKDIARDLAAAFHAPIEQVLADVVAIGQRFVDDGIATVGLPTSADLDTVIADELVAGSPGLQVLPEPPSP